MPPVSATRTDRFSKILFWSGILIIPTILIIQVLVYQPFFGHMDDGLWIRIVESGGVLQNIKDFALFSPRGLSRASSMLLTLPTYWGATYVGATGAYLLNIAIAVVPIMIFSISTVFALSLPIRVSLIAFLASLLWPFTYELVFFMSLNDKGVILTAGLVTLVIASSRKISRNGFFFLALLGSYLLMANSKTQAITFVPGLIVLGWALVPTRNLSKSRAMLNTFLGAAVFVTLPVLDFAPGNYGGAQRSGDIASNFRATYAMLILGIVVAYGIYVGVRFLRGKRNYLELVPLVMMATFWASIVYFGYRNYYLSVFGVMFGSAVAVVVGNLKSVRLQQLATVGLIVVTVGWTLYRIPQVFEPLHGIGAFTQGQIAKDLADEGAVIYTSCVEGSGHFNYYTERKWGVTPEFKPLEGDGAGYRFGIPDDGQYVLGDRRLCAVPGEMAEWEVIWASPGDDGFRLYKRPA
jgi:hypothetical protein